VAGCRPDRAPAAARAAVAAAVAFGLVTAAAGGFGELFTGMATDPGTGPVLALLALTYWPHRVALHALAEPAGPAAPRSPYSAAPGLAGPAAPGLVGPAAPGSAGPAAPGSAGPAAPEPVDPGAPGLAGSVVPGLAGPAASAPADPAGPAHPSATRAWPDSAAPSITPVSLGAPGPQGTAEGAGPWG